MNILMIGVATGETHTVREFLEEAFGYLNLKWEDYVETSKKFYRPNEVEHLLGDYSKANKFLNWSPKTDFSKLVQIMVDEDLKLAKQEKLLLEEG